MQADVNTTILLVNASDGCRSSVDFGPASKVQLQRVPHPWKWPNTGNKEAIQRHGHDLPDWFIVADTGLGRPVTFWANDPRVTLSEQ